MSKQTHKTAKAEGRQAPQENYVKQIAEGEFEVYYRGNFMCSAGTRAMAETVLGIMHERDGLREQSDRQYQAFKGMEQQAQAITTRLQDLRRAAGNALEYYTGGADKWAAQYRNDPQVIKEMVELYDAYKRAF